jgi:uncharacterized membrane protein
MAQPSRILGRISFMCCLALLPVQTRTTAAPAVSPPKVDVTTDLQGAGGLVHATVDIAAPPALVWGIMIDCASMTQLMVNVKTCRVIDRDPAGRWDVREQITKASLVPAVRAVIRSEYDAPHLIRFHRVDGDFRVLEGEWRLEPLNGGLSTRVTYDSRMSAPFSVPNFMIRAVLRHDLPRTLMNLRVASESRNEALTRMAQTEAGRP